MSTLKEYNKKRDFKKTKEPSGEKTKKKKVNEKLSFVVQEHHARRLHWDFRLELDGVLKSWAVPKGPSLNPADKRLAVQTEDHPLDYGSFEGTIPKGEYGGGEVFIWDKGTWECDDANPLSSLEKGKLEFSLKGEKLKGKWRLIRTHYQGESKKNWLLMKRHDEEELNPTNNPEMDPWPGFISPQLPRLVSEPPSEDETGWLHEMKYDGYRIQAHLQNGIAQFKTRNGLDWSNQFPHLLTATEKLPVQSAIFDGEIVALDELGRSNFQKLQKSFKAKNDTNLKYYIFDILYLDGKDLRNLPLLERKEILENIMENAHQSIIFSEHFLEQAQDFYQVSCEHQLEGIISKRIDSSYRSGRNDLWVKTKCFSRQEFVIGGWTDAQGGRTGFGALLLGVYEKNKLKYAGKVGTGFNAKTLRSIKKGLSPLEQDESPFDINSPKGKNIHWVEPIKVAEVSFANWTDEEILRTPVFISLREDKAPTDILRERPRRMIKTKLRLVKEISSPEKVLFKHEKITKKEVAEFYQVIAHHMLPYLSNRPLSLVRCPHGSEESCFFQKHISGSIPESLITFPIQEGKGVGNYLSIDSQEGLMELVQLNAFEIHAWNCHIDDYLRPDQIVMDLDPGDGVEWSRVVEAAFAVKQLLEDLDLKSYVKLTGGKGLHVHVPIAPVYNWDQVKSFSQTLALELVSRHPDRYTANMSKKIRKNKIFIDYLRNGYGATAVVPYSLRARATSAIALPVSWKELKKIKGGQEFTMKKARRKLASRKIDPWEGFLDMRQEINILNPDKKSA